MVNLGFGRRLGREDVLLRIRVGLGNSAVELLAKSRLISCTQHDTLLVRTEKKRWA